VIGQRDVAKVVEPPRVGRSGRQVRGRRALLPGLAALVLVAAAVVAGVATGLPGRWFVPQPLPTTIAVGFNPAAVAVDLIAHRAYVANQGDGTVTVLDTTRNAVVATIRVGNYPESVEGVAVDPVAHRAYVTSGHSVAVIDTRRNAVVATFDADSLPAGIALDPAAHRAYLVAPGIGIVRVLDTRSNAHVGAVRVGELKELSGSSAGLALDPVAHRAYVAVPATPGSPMNSVAVIDTDATLVVDTIPVGRRPAGVALDPAAHRAYVTNSDSNSVSVLDTQRDVVVAGIRVGAFPTGVALDPAVHRAYVANSNGRSVSVIDTRRNVVVATLLAGFGPVAVAVDPATHRVYVANQGDGTVSVLEGGA